jgi:hypothetical protein
MERPSWFLFPNEAFHTPVQGINLALVHLYSQCFNPTNCLVSFAFVTPGTNVRGLYRKK